MARLGEAIIKIGGKNMKKVLALAYSSADDMVFGKCPKPVTCKNGMVIGGGEVFPEINFTLPNIKIDKDTLPEVLKIYGEIISGVLQKAHELHAPGVVVEYETLPEFTYNPEWGIAVHKVLRETMFEFEAKHGLKSVLRMTPNDVREFNRPPIMRSGEYWSDMLTVFEQTARDGADILSIESTGGKEINDAAIINVDLKTSIFALGCLLRLKTARLVPVRTAPMKISTSKRLPERRFRWKARARAVRIFLRLAISPPP
jgi:methanol--5-hydroxybenzimidazolylcobamide Co-methyltransferase